PAVAETLEIEHMAVCKATIAHEADEFVFSRVARCFDSRHTDLAIDWNVESILEESDGWSDTLVYRSIKHRHSQTSGKITAMRQITVFLDINLFRILYREGSNVQVGMGLLRDALPGRTSGVGCVVGVSTFQPDHQIQCF